MAAAPRFESSVPLLATPGIVAHSAAIAPAAPPVDTAAAMSALAAVGDAFAGETKRAASLPPAKKEAPTENLMPELVERIRRDWNKNMYFCSVITPMTFEDVQHFTPRELIALCFANIIAIVLQNSKLSIENIITLTNFKVENIKVRNIDKLIDLVRVFNGIISKL